MKFNRESIIAAGLFCFAVTAQAVEQSTSMGQKETMLTINYGNVYGNVEDSDANASGWRLNGSYEVNRPGNKFWHGIGFGYIETTGESARNSEKVDYTLTSFPIYYQPKILFGKESLKGFVKGALGWHFSDYEATGTLARVETNESGLYAGIAAGGMFVIKTKYIISLEYEWAYLDNYYYRDNAVQSAMLGFGIKL